MASRSRTHAAPRPVVFGWLLVGFALGGFFDGILLHQILQWHHLLSGLDGASSANLPFQIMMDGVFHLLMYVLGMFGMVLILRGRADGATLGTSRILQLTLIGFAAWHILDAVLSHWLLGIHRIRQDSAQPLFWDLAWLVIFALGPLALSWLLNSRGQRGGDGGQTAATALLVLTIVAGSVAGIGPTTAGQKETIVVFRKNLSEQAMMDSVLASGASVRWTDPSGRIWGISNINFTGALTLYAKGATLVSTTPVVAGCLRWTQS